MRKITAVPLKSVALLVLLFFASLSALGTYFAFDIKSNYSMEQFLPRKHSLLTWDQESKRLFHIHDTSPYIVLLSLDPSNRSFWYGSKELAQLQHLSDEIAGLEGVRAVMSLGNVQSSFEKNSELLVSTIGDLRKHGFDARRILRDPLYTPNLISRDGLHTAIFVTPRDLSQEEHKPFLDRLEKLAIEAAPQARVQIGGPAAIRTEFVTLLSREVLLFILLSLFCAIVVVKVMFHGVCVLPQTLLILFVANAVALGLMGAMHVSLNVLSSTLPIIVTITALGISAHTLVRMAEGAHLPFAERMEFLRELMRELALPHLLTAATTGLGFATLMLSHVPLIADYGKVVFFGVLVAAVTTLAVLPALYVWSAWPRPREFLNDSRRFSFFLVGNARWITPAIGVLVILCFAIGSHLSWTAKLFDDLPMNHSARRSTDLVSAKLGGVATVDFVIGHDSAAEAWKQPENIAKLRALAREWRADKEIGSVLTLADFLATGANKRDLPTKREGIAELEFLYSMAGDSPLEQFLSFDEKWTRIAVRLPDLPANRNRGVIEHMRERIRAAFPNLEVKVAGLAAVVPTINDELSSELMWGFFSSLFWIVLLLTVVFRSLRWALVAVIPNLVPPTLLLGFLALFHVPIKPGIAIIFSISLGLAFCNTVYVLERLKVILKSNSRKFSLPIYALMKKETMPCLVSSLSLFGGFSIFLFSVFPMNKLFGLFMLASIAAGLLGDLVWLPAMLKRFPWLLLENIEEGLDRISPRWKALAKVGPYAVLFALGIVAFHSVYASF